MDKTFQKAYERLLEAEGLYANQRFDKGGETYAGISRRFNPDWPGWPIVDGKAAGDLGLLVRGFYEGLWVEWGLAGMRQADLQTYLFDTGVLFGGKRAIQWLQEALTILGHRIALDGVVGAETLTVVNNMKPPEAQATKALLTYKRIDHHQKTIMRSPEQRKFFIGWLARAVRP